MSEAAVPDQPAPEPARERRTGRWRWPRRIVGVLALLAALAALLLVVADTGPGHRFVASRINGLTPSNGLRYSVGRIEGSIYGKAVLHDVRVRDPKGLVFAAPVAELDWRPFAWMNNRLDIRSLHIPAAALYKLPQTIPSGKKNPILPGFDISIGSLRVDTLWLSPRVAGQKRRSRIVGRAEVHKGRALVDLGAEVEGSDLLKVKLDAEPDRDRFDVDAVAKGSADGVMARLSKLNRPIGLRILGDGKWSDWNGAARLIAGDERLIDLQLANRSGVYRARGKLAPGMLLKGGLKRLASPGVAIDLSTTLANRRLDGRLSLSSPAIRLDGEGVIDLANSSFRNLQVSTKLLRPKALIGNMDGRNIELRLVLDGGFSDGRFEYRAAADRLSFDNTGIERIGLSGAGRLSKAPIAIPVRLTAARVTGVGDVAGGILANLSLEGVLRASSDNLVGNDLRLKSDKLSGLLTLFVDFRSGRYEVGLNGGLKRYLIPGLGIVDLDSRLSVVPGPDGKGTRIIGRGVAQMVRLDNGFFRSLTKGLPRIETGLERGPDGILHFKGLKLTSPALRLTGNGYRRHDGSFHFEGSGDQSTYGPLTLVLDGKIDRPKLKLHFLRPNDALGLSDVDATLDPTAEGYAFAATGGSRLGPFTGDGAILLPRGGQAAIRVDRLDVSGTRAKGLIQIADAGFEGDVGFTGGGLDGRLHFAPVNGVQAIEGDVTARNAALGPGMSVRRARASFRLLFDPDGASVTANVQAGGLSNGSMRIGRLVADVQMRGGDGTIKATLSGSRGRAFNIDTMTEIRGDTYTVNAQGTVDQMPIKLVTPAVLTARDGGWRLAETQLSFNGGGAIVSGAFGRTGIELNAGLRGMPLSVLDIGYPGLALGGIATGTFSFVDRPGEREQGRIDMKVRGLTRSGLVLSSRPVDVGVAGVLGGGKAAARAVIASGGKTIGRAQMRLAPVAAEGGTLFHRIINAPAFAQFRYDGPADTLWRLTGVELFDLSGPVAIGADVTGRLAEPVIRGSLRSDNARLESAVMGAVLTGVKARGSFNGSQLVIQSFAGGDGRGGSVTGQGTFDLAAAHGFGIDLTINAKNAVLIDRDDIGATATGTVKVTSDGSGGLVSGDLRLDAARYKLGQAAVSTPIPKLDVREINLPFGSGDDDDVNTKPWQLEVNAQTGNLHVTGLGLTSLWGAGLKLRGDPTNPSIAGEADLIRGDYEFAGRQFELQRGIIRFDGRTPANPSLDIAAQADTDGLTATIKVTGNAERPEISFASVPALPQDELLSRLLFGTSITNLSAPEALQLAAAVAALNNSGGGLDPINAVRNAVGLDRLRILPADPTTGQQTSVAAGKYVTRRAYVEIITDGAGYSATRLEYRVTRWLSLLSSISTIGRQSASVRVSKDY